MLQSRLSQFAVALGLALAAISGLRAAPAAQTLDLAGTWEFRLDADDQGVLGEWYEAAMPDQVRLPGSSDEQGFGVKATPPEMGRLTREYSYVGPAWYRRSVTIPEEWQGKQIGLTLERCHWETQVWVDGRPAGMRNSLSAPHIYDLTPLLTPGRHTLAIRVDNRLKINVCHYIGNWVAAHSVSDETQTNWNGIIGRIALDARDPVALDTVQVYPDPQAGKLTVKAVVNNRTQSTVEGTLALATEPDCGSLTGHPVKLAPGLTTVEVSAPIQEGRLWDEFNPHVYQLAVTLQTADAQQSYSDRRVVPFGLRTVGQQDQHLTLNGRKIFLRGNLECCIFPLTGYPPMDVEGWKRVIATAQEYGLNHLRFHSWCPPEAAFAAADAMGMILQVEAPVWDGYGLLGNNAESAAWIVEEAGRILDAYGNHPSFCLMSMGNEWGNGKALFIQYLVEFARNKDPRHYYTATTQPAVPGRNDDFFAAAGTEHGPLRGLGPFVNKQPATLNDFRASLAGNDRPFIVHEVGQPCLYPDYNQIAKYTGHLKPRNLEAFRESLDAHHMLDQNADFQRATGALAVAIYKENIEAIMRTPGLSGYQLLGIQDFPGQGTALIGILDAFWDSKGVVTPEAWRQFCSPTVPLLRMKQFVWTDDDPFAAEAEVAHYGAADLTQVQPRWSVTAADGRTVAEGRFDPLDIKTGGNTPLGQIRMDWGAVKAPAQLRIKLWLEGTTAVNQWNLWVYPAATAVTEPAEVLIAEEWNDVVKTALAEGGRVLLLPRRNELENTEPARWNPVFWCYQLFKTQPKTMGILCDPSHPALAEFPTEFFGDWQWFDLLERSEAIVLDDTPAAYRPVVQFIHDFNFNSKLGAIFEANVGKGRLLVSSIDLTGDLAKRPAARQLRRSLLEYMQSGRFDPPMTLEPAALDKILKKRSQPNRAQAPGGLASARLHVKAAGRIEKMGVAAPWTPEADRVLRQDDGFGYSVAGGTWRDGGGSAWHDPHLVTTLACPSGFTGTLYVHFHDWNDAGRNAHLFFEGRDLGLLGRYDREGTWLKLAVTAADSADGKLALDTRAMSGPNVMITELALLPADSE